MTSNNDGRLNLLIDCLEQTYVEFRKKIPDYLEREARLSMKYFYHMDDDEIVEAFQYACRMTDGDRPPLTKDIVRMWMTNSGRTTVHHANQCSECDSGYRVGFITEDDGYVKTLSMRCPCALGQTLPDNILTWKEDGVLRLKTPEARSNGTSTERQPLIQDRW